MRYASTYDESGAPVVAELQGDLQKLTVPQAKADGCTPCTACQPTG